jgi:hypothetical protein
MAISFIALVTLVSYGNEPNKMTDLIISMSGYLFILSIAPTPSHGKKWLAMIWDTRAGRPRPAASPGAADVDRRHCRRRCPPRPHRATIVAVLAIAAVSAIATVAHVLLVVTSAAADAVSPRSRSFHRRRRP